MPWKETFKMNQKTEFALKSMSTENFRELCREYGISAKTGYKWKQRFMERGLGGMDDESRRPHGHALGLAEEVVCNREAQDRSPALGTTQDPCAV
jgi:transposase-like protein